MSTKYQTKAESAPPPFFSYPIIAVVVVVVGLSPTVILSGPGTIGGMPFVEVFLRNLTHIYPSFGENQSNYCDEINKTPSVKELSLL